MVKAEYACLGCCRQFAEGDESMFPEWQHERCGGLVRKFASPFAAAVPAGNQAKTPTALDEMRALQEGAAAERHTPSVIDEATPSVLATDGIDWSAMPDNLFHNSDCDCDLCEPSLAELSALRAQLTESREALTKSETELAILRAFHEVYVREALARVEAELKECQARNNELIDAFRRADAESRDLRRKLEDVTQKLTANNHSLARALEENRLELRKRDAVIEAAIKVRAGYGLEQLNAALDALDQAASGPECAQKGHAYATNKGECCIYCFRPKAECLHMGEPASEAEATPAVCGKWITDAFLQDCGLPHGHSGACQSRVSDPEATESATKEAT